MTPAQFRRVLAVDPGLTTGLAEGLDEIGGGGFSVVATGEYRCTPFELYGVLEGISPGVIVCESFEYRIIDEGKTGTNLISRNLLGVCELWTQERQRILVMQTPAYAKGTFPNSRLKKYEAYTVGSEHARDATRHLLTWAYFGKGSKYRGPESRPD